MENNFRQLSINGALVALYKTESLKAVSIDVRIKAGSWYEEGEKWGKAHLLEHMLFQGTEKFADSKAMEVYKEENGIWSNALTSGQRLELMLRMPSESMEAGFLLMEEMLFKMTIPEEKLSVEKRVIGQEYEDKWSRPNARFSKKVDEQYFGKGHRYTRDGLGNIEYINGVSRQELLDYQKKMFVPSNMVIAVVGNIDFEEIEKYLRNILVQKGNKIEEIFDAVKPQSGRLVHIEFGMSTASIDVGWTTKGIGESSIEDRYAMGIGCYLLGGSPRSILHTRIREEMGMAYKISIVFGFYQVAGWLSIKSSVKLENLEDVLEEINKAIESFVNKPIENDLFLRAKKYLIMNAKMKYESTMGIAEDFCGLLFWEGKVVLPEEIEVLLNKITEDQVRKVIKDAMGGREPMVSIMRSE